MNYSEFKKDLPNVLNRVVSDRNPTVITRQNAEPTVLISLEDFNAYEETAYLLSSSTNAQRLQESIVQARNGQIYNLVHFEK